MAKGKPSSRAKKKQSAASRLDVKSLNEINEELKAFYDAGLKRLEEIRSEEKKIVRKYKQLQDDELTPLRTEREDLQRRLDRVAPSLGRRRRFLKKRSKRRAQRIKTETLWEAVKDILSDGSSKRAGDIIQELIQKGFADTESTRSRTYAALSNWTNEGLLKKAERGIYRLAKKK